VRVNALSFSAPRALKPAAQPLARVAAARDQILRVKDADKVPIVIVGNKVSFLCCYQPFDSACDFQFALPRYALPFSFP
jgi:hypothetical protein